MFDSAQSTLYDPRFPGACVHLKFRIGLMRCCALSKRFSEMNQGIRAVGSKGHLTTRMYSYPNTDAVLDTGG